MVVAVHLVDAIIWIDVAVGCDTATVVEHVGGPLGAVLVEDLKAVAVRVAKKLATDRALVSARGRPDRGGEGEGVRKKFSGKFAVTSGGPSLLRWTWALRRAST